MAGQALDCQTSTPEGALIVNKHDGSYSAHGAVSLLVKFRGYYDGQVQGVSQIWGALIVELHATSAIVSLAICSNGGIGEIN